jgi:hypothetical protein
VRQATVSAVTESPDGGILDRYHAVGLTGNPFSVHVHDADTDVIDVEWFVDRGIPDPPGPGRATLVQVIGEQGAGKSTHLAHWRRHRPGPHHYVPRSPYRTRWHRPPVGPLVHGDEIDRMPIPLRSWWFHRLGRRAATVVIGSHRDLSRPARRAGLTVRTHHLAPVDARELGEVVRRRLAAAALPGRQLLVSFTERDLRAVLDASGGNLRAADGLCHRLVAQRVA